MQINRKWLEDGIINGDKVDSLSAFTVNGVTSNGDVIINSDATITGTLAALGAFYNPGYTSVDNFNILNRLSVGGDSSLMGKTYMYTDASIAGEVYAGDIVDTGNLTVYGDFTSNGVSDFNGLANFDNTSTFNSLLNVAGTLQVAGPSVFSDLMTVNADVSCSANFSTVNFSTVGFQATDMTGANVRGLILITTPTLNVDQTATIATGNITTLNILGDASVSGDMTVIGDATFSGEALFSDATVLGNFQVVGSSILNTLATSLITANASGIIVNAGGLSVVSGGLDVTSGGLRVVAGGVSVTAGGLTVDSGNMTLNTVGGTIGAPSGTVSGSVASFTDATVSNLLKMSKDASCLVNMYVGGTTWLNGNVGIGTSIPAASMHVESFNPTITAQNSIPLTGNYASTIKMQIDGTNSLSQLNLYSVDHYTLPGRSELKTSNGLKKFFINISDGTNFKDVATFNSNGLLDISGAVQIRGGSPASGRYLTSDATGLASWTSAINGWTKSATNVYTSDSTTSSNSSRVGIGITDTGGYTLHIYNRAGIGTGCSNIFMSGATGASSYYTMLSTGYLGNAYAGPTSVCGLDEGTFLISNSSVASGLYPPIVISTLTAHAPIVFGIANSERVRISTAGYVGIGTTDPSTNLDVNGNARFRNVTNGTYAYNLNLTATGLLTTATSDIRKKENIVTISDALSKVLSLRGVYFTWKSDPDMGRKIGLIAQEVESVIPEAVYTTPDVEGTKGLWYGELTSVLIEAIKELKNRIEILESKVP